MNITAYTKQYYSNFQLNVLFVSVLFLHDDALLHKVSSMKKLFFQFGVEETHWSTQSPDLNSMQH